MHNPAYVIFDAPPGIEAPRFVESERESGHSCSLGKWEPSGAYWRLGPVYTASDIYELESLLRDARRVIGAMIDGEALSTMLRPSVLRQLAAEIDKVVEPLPQVSPLRSAE